MMFDLLSEPLLTLESAGGSRRAATLPGVLATLGRGEEIEFPRLRPHQHHPWFAFLVQLGTLALERAGLGALDEEEGVWREALVRLAEGERESWCLVVEDLAKPAFMQPPVPEGSLAKWVEQAAPDEVDMLVTRKDFDLKEGLLQRPHHEDWIYMLVTVQTFAGYPGRGNRGIARMNGGQGSRPLVTRAPADDWARRFRRDVALWRGQRERVAREVGFDPVGGVTLLWRVPWEGGDEQLVLSACDPAVIEICRRLRLRVDGTGRVVCARTVSAKERLAAKDRKGVLGDPWVPVDGTDKEGPKALTVSARGFDYKKVHELLFEGGKYWTAALDEGGEGDGLWIGRVLVRGQGKTEGLKERLLVIPEPYRRRGFLTGTDKGRELAERSASQITVATNVWKKVLRFALVVLIAGKGETLPRNSRALNPWHRRYERWVDDHFFEHLWTWGEDKKEAADVAWQKKLLGMARELLAEAIRTAPVPPVRRYRREHEAWSAFAGAAGTHFGDAWQALMEDKEEERYDAAAG